MRFYYDDVWAALYIKKHFNIELEIEPTADEVEFSPSAASYPLEHVSVYAESDLSSAIIEIEASVGQRRMYVKDPEFLFRQVGKANDGKVFIVPKIEGGK